jgi:type III pantothenate kinase
LISKLLAGSKTPQIIATYFPKELNRQLFASVVPKSIPEVTSFIKSNFNLSPFILKYSNAPIKFNYPHPETLGADRIANCIAALHIYGAPSIVVGFGTAVTIDVINRDGIFEGGF